MSDSYRVQAAQPVFSFVEGVFSGRFLPLAEGLRPGISTPTELNEGLSPRFFATWLTFANSSITSLTKYMRVWLTIWVRISRVHNNKFARADLRDLLLCMGATTNGLAHAIGRR